MCDDLSLPLATRPTSKIYLVRIVVFLVFFWIQHEYSSIVHCHVKVKNTPERIIRRANHSLGTNLKDKINHWMKNGFARIPWSNKYSKHIFYKEINLFIKYELNYIRTQRFDNETVSNSVHNLDISLLLFQLLQQSTNVHFYCLFLISPYWSILIGWDHKTMRNGPKYAATNFRKYYIAVSSCLFVQNSSNERRFLCCFFLRFF